jgi:hypothetical protein
MSFVNPNTWHLIYNNFNLNFIFGIVYLFVCVCVFSLRRESPDMILGDKSLIFEVVLSQYWRIRALLGSTNLVSSTVAELDDTPLYITDDIGIVFGSPTDYPSRFSRGRRH